LHFITKTPFGEKLNRKRGIIKMKECCAEKIIEMQKVVQVGKWLKLLIAASPFILVAPNLDPSMNLEAGEIFIIEELNKISVEQARGTLMKKTSMPSFGEACKAADCVTVNQLAGMAQAHANRHLMSPEQHLWEKMAASYLAAVANGNCTQPVGGWFSWN
jgi:hypothetical protein